MADKLVYFFGKDKTEGDAKMKELLGGKGANLAEMTNVGIPVPAGFTITTEVCDLYYKNGRQYPADLDKQVDDNLAKLEEAMGMKFGDPTNPLLVSVRSGAAASMPGMMDTVLNLGLNDEVVAGLAKKTGNDRFAKDAYRRFIQMFGDVVMGVEHHDYEHILEGIKKEKGAKLDTDLSAADLDEVIAAYKKLVKEKSGEDFPTDPKQQLWKSITAVFDSWNNPRAIKYRQLNDIRGLIGTAVNVQAMVYGNMGDTSGTGVCFTRNPSTGENLFYGEFLINAQGEDVVAGIRTPEPIDQLDKEMPEIYKQLVAIRSKLEDHYKDMQDIEFTVQEGTLYILQTRNGKRTGAAAVRIAVELVGENVIDKKEALQRVDPAALDQLLHPMIDPKSKFEVVAKGLPASPGAAVGEVVFTAEDAERADEQGRPVILVRIETSPEDIGGMHVAKGILTARGGMTSHAAVVARGMGTCCVAGCHEVKIDYKAKTATIGDKVIKEGDVITLNGSTGEVILDKVTLIEPQLSGNFRTLMEWADEVRKLKIRTNSDTPHDTTVARGFGAEGIGLCRTEHMFFEGDRIDAVREMILADDVDGRKKALTKLLPMQKSDFIGIFEAMQGFPVTIRLLDPPLHEFVPHTDKEISALADKLGVTKEKLKAKVDSLHEFNPMLGHRGCRLAVTYPEIYDMQVEAIFEAACEVEKSGTKVFPEVMIPLVGDVAELKMLKANALEVAQTVLKRNNSNLEYLIGTMIEVPRAALTADDVAKEAQFFSFGTNDLTQMTFGFSRDDAGVFLTQYIEKGILEKDPFQELDQTGVGKLVEIGVEKGRSVNPDLKIGICGEHGGDPKSVEFCHRVGLNYVSCSPYRVPIARLAAAQAALKNGSNAKV